MLAGIPKKEQTNFLLSLGAISGGLAAASYGFCCIIVPAVALFALGIFCWPFRDERK
jgi:hypothetical protein